MDKTDIKILKILQVDAEKSVADIARQVNLSQSSCWRRISQLREQGIIQRSVAILDREKLGLDVVVFSMVSLITQSGSALTEFEDRVRHFDEVVECYTMTGQTDFLLKIVTRDMRHYEKFVRNQLAQLPNIREMHSHVAVTNIKDTTALPLDTQLTV